MTPAAPLRWINAGAAVASHHVRLRFRPGGGGCTMLTFEDRLGLSELTEAEILAIAEHENLPEAAALELGNYLIQTPGGDLRVKRIIVEDIEHALRCGDQRRSAELKQVLRHFCERHRAQSS
jgi:hypothetical protein